MNNFYDFSVKFPNFSVETNAIAQNIQLFNRAVNVEIEMQ